MLVGCLAKLRSVGRTTYLYSLYIGAGCLYHWWLMARLYNWLHLDWLVRNCHMHNRDLLGTIFNLTGLWGSDFRHSLLWKKYSTEGHVKMRPNWCKRSMERGQMCSPCASSHRDEVLVEYFTLNRLVAVYLQSWPTSKIITSKVM